MTLYRIRADLRFHELQLEEDWAAHYMRVLRLPASEAKACSQTEILRGKVVETGIGLADFAPGPGSTFLVSERLRNFLVPRYESQSLFDKVEMAGAEEPYFVWMLLTVTELISPSWRRPIGFMWGKAAADWLPEHIIRADVTRESRFRGRWFCVDNPSVTDTFFRAVRDSDYSGFDFVKCWQGGVEGLNK